MNRRRRHILRDERGVAASEFALILPVLTMLLFGFYEAGRMYWNYNIVQSSARDAARYAARMPMTCDSGGVGAFVDAGDEAEIQNLTRTGTLDGTGDPLVAGWTNNATVNVSISCVDNSSATYSGRYDGHTKIPTVNISATAPHGALFGGLVGYSLNTITVSNAQAWTE
jgi:Flp pilus assembly protein TadG